MTDSSYQRLLSSLPDDLKNTAHELSPDAMVQLFQLRLRDDPDEISQTTLYFWAGEDITYLGDDYLGVPCALSGVAVNTDGEANRPNFSIVNPEGLFSAAIARGYTTRAVLTEYRMLLADLHTNTGQHMVRRWIINKTLALNKYTVSFELRDLTDGQDFKLPPRVFASPEFPSVSS